MGFIESAVDFLKINSISRSGNEEIINFLIPLYEKLGAKIIIQQLPHSIEDFSKRQFNIIGILGDTLVDPSTPKGLMLVSHVDTSIAGEEARWDKLSGKPWNANIIDDKIYGLGASSAKLDFLCKLRAVENYQNFEFKQPVYLVATCGGESILSGAKYLIQSRVVNPRHVLLGHPTNLSLGYAHKGRLVLSTRLQFLATARDAQEFNARIRLQINTDSGPISASHGRASAIDRLFDLLDFFNQQEIAIKLFNLESDDCFNKVSEKAIVDLVISRDDIDLFRRKFRNYIAENPELNIDVDTGSAGSQGIALFPEHTLDILISFYQEIRKINEEFRAVSDTQFDYPHSFVSISAISRMRDTVEFFLDFNLIPEHSPSRVKREIEANLKERLQRIVPALSSISIGIRKLYSSAPLFTDPKSSFLHCLDVSLKRVGIPTDFRRLSCATDAAFFSERGIDTVVFGPGDEENSAYRWNEHNEVNKIELATRFYMEVIDSICIKERCND